MRVTSMGASAGVLVAAAMLIACDDDSSSPSSAYQVGPRPARFQAIQEAVDAAPPGEYIDVLPGTYRERVVVNKPLKLRGWRAVLDGAAAGGTGIGILVTGTSDVEVSGFTVERFERGIVLQNVSNSIVIGNEVRNNTAKNAPPFTFGVTPFEGIVLIASRDNEVSENYSHDNGHDGLMVTAGSAGNRIRNNRFTDNGSQTPTRVG